jgi:GTP-binding protein
MHTVAIVGRPNVGKSALFNSLSGKQISLVHDQPGVTRDRITVNCRHDGHAFELVDTGGIGLEDEQGFSAAIAHEVEMALAMATDIIFVVDGRDGLTSLDEEIGRKLRRGADGKPRRVLLAVNKLDVPQLDGKLDEFHGLGLGEMVALSSAHGRGIEELLELMVSVWTREEGPQLERPDRPVRLAFLGRPNVGKSSLVNALLEDKRTIVSPVAGTTRDAVDVPFTWKGRPFTLIDTAGMRQRRKVHDPLEVKMTGRSAHTINRANICILVLDAMDGVHMQDKKIGGLIHEAARPCMILVNKWDLVREQGDVSKKKEQEYLDAIRADLFFLDYAPVIFGSAKTGERVEHILRAVEKIEENRIRKIGTAELNDLLQKAQEKYSPPLVHNRRFRIYYATHQLDATQPHPTPTFVCFINSHDLLVPAYERYLELKLREKFNLEGCPLRFIWREKATLPEEEKISRIIGKQSGKGDGAKEAPRPARSPFRPKSNPEKKK